MHYRLVLVTHRDDFQVDVGDCEQSYWHILITEQRAEQLFDGHAVLLDLWRLIDYRIIIGLCGCLGYGLHEVVDRFECANEKYHESNYEAEKDGPSGLTQFEWVVDEKHGRSEKEEDQICPLDTNLPNWGACDYLEVFLVCRFINDLG